jgi:hypothetical protein
VNSGAPEELAVPVLLMTMPPISAMRIPAVAEKIKQTKNYTDPNEFTIS